MIPSLLCVFGFLVLPDRIELSTSPLPRECSTTELRQRSDVRDCGVPCHRGGTAASSRGRENGTIASATLVVNRQ